MSSQTPSAGPKLVGENYITPDLRAKLTGAARYTEDFRADGMLHCKLLVSPMPHARVKRINTQAALAMPGVKAIITADDLPTPGDSVTDTGAVIHASQWGERALTMEPVFQGDPILAVAAVDELTAAEAIEKIELELEPLPFAIDPLASLRPGGPNARIDGNVWVQPEAAPAKPGEPPPAPPPLEVRELKWTQADFAAAKDGQMPLGKPTAQWSYGDVEGGLASAALVLDETFATANTSHQCLETRSTLAYWQNGKVFIHAGTQSTMQTVPAISRWLGVPPENIVFISEYTGGGFGSKITASIPIVIPAVLAKKTNAPVMMRVTREEEQYIGRARPSLLGRVRAGFSKEGRLTALHLHVIQDNGPYEQNNDFAACGRMVSLMYQPQAMRWQGTVVLTNTPTRSAQTAPGGMQGMAIMEPVMAKAARRLGIDQVAMRRLNAPEGKAPIGPAGADGKRAYVTSAFVQEALDLGARNFRWEERQAAKPKDGKGPKVRGLGVAVSCFVSGTTGFDGLFVIKPDGTVRFHSGIGNLGTESVSDVHRVAAEALGVPWERCELVWGNTGKNLPWSCVSGGSQTIHAMTRAALAAALDAKKKLKEIAAQALGGQPEDYEVAGERVFNASGQGLSLGEAAGRAVALGGVYDGHEFPDNLNRLTKASVKALAGQGLVAVARDTFPRDGLTHSYVASFAEVEVDRETGMYRILDFRAVADSGVVVHPRAHGAQVLGRSMLGIGHAIGQKWVYDQHYGLPVAKRFYQTKPPTILDVPDKMAWDSLGIPDPETPTGARGIGEPPVGAACCAVCNALADALGDDLYTRLPVTADVLLASLEAGKSVQAPLAADV